MLDPLLRRLIDPPLNVTGRFLAARGVPATAVTGIGFAAGLCVVPVLAMGWYGLALGIIAFNRVLDGVDGAVARAHSTEASEFGGYVDIVADMVFYASVVFGFALADPANAIWAALLLAGFVGTCASFLGHAVVAARRGDVTTARGEKSFFHAGGIVEGTETILFLAAMCLFPEAFSWLAILFAVLCGGTIVGRVIVARRQWTVKESA